MDQLQPIEVQLLHIGVSLNRPTIADPHVGYLRQFCKNDVACFFYFLEFAMFEQIPKPLVFLVECDIMKILIINEFLFGVDWFLLGASELGLVFGRSFGVFLAIVAVEGGSEFIIGLWHFEYVISQLLTLSNIDKPHQILTRCSTVCLLTPSARPIPCSDFIIRLCIFIARLSSRWGSCSAPSSFFCDSRLRSPTCSSLRVLSTSIFRFW